MSMGPRRSGTSLRGIFTRTVAFMFVTVLLFAAALVASNVALRHAADRVDDAHENFRATSDAEIRLLGFARTLSWLPAADARSLINDSSQGPLDRLLDPVRPYVDTATEAALLGRAERDIRDYVSELRRMLNDGASTVGAREVARPHLDDALAALADMRDYNSAEIRDARALADRLEWSSALLGLALALGLALLASGVLHRLRTAVYDPIVGIVNAIDEFRGGNTQVRLRTDLPTELARISQAFNETVEQLNQQHEDRLAFVAGVAHDLRNPVQAIRLASAQFRRAGVGLSQEERARTVEVVDRQLDRLNRMVVDLLDAVHIEAGQLALRLATVDLRDVISDVARQQEHGPLHVLSSEVPRGPVLVRADPMRIEQVLANLLSNALKYSPKGGHVRVTLGTEGGFATLAVSDDGIGIPLDKRELIFQPFRRLDLRGNAPGHGLGLSVVRRIVEAHGGTIVVESTPGVGSTFTVRLPLAPAKVSLVPLPGGGRARSAPPSGPG